MNKWIGIGIGGLAYPKVFEVIDKKTGKEADIQQIVKEDWAQRLVYSDILGFLINDEGELYLADRCGNLIQCSYDRFKVVFVGSWRALGDY